MVRGIASLGERRGTTEVNPALRGNPPIVWVSHLAGAALGGGVLAAAGWLFAAPLRTLIPAPVAIVLAIAVCLGAAAVDLRWLRLPTLLRRGQVPVEWLTRYGFTRGYLFYGVALGAGVFTFVPFAATFAAFAAAALLPGIAVALVAGAAFGTGRAILVGPLATSSAAVAHSDQLLVVGYRWFPRVSATLCLALAVVVLASTWAGT
jgi:hypothetical protein